MSGTAKAKDFKFCTLIGCPYKVLVSVRQTIPQMSMVAVT